MVLSRLCFFRRGLTTAVFREFGKVPERSEVFTTSKRSASKPLSTLLKEDVGSVSREKVDDLRSWTISFKNITIKCLEKRQSLIFEIAVESVWPPHNLRMWQSPFWNYWSSQRRRKQTHCICCQRAFHWECTLGWGCQSLNSSKKSASV